MRASHAFAYDAANNRTSAFSAQAGATAKAMTAAHNSMNQITTLGGGGKTRVAGSLDEPGQVSVGIVGQGDTTGDPEVSGEIGRMPNPKGETSRSERVKPARMLSGNRFETELDLPAGTSSLQITAADGSANLATNQYSVVTSPETSRTVTHDADGNMTSDGVRTHEWDTWSRLTKITWATGKTTTFHYNGLGERTKMVHTDGSTTRTEYYLYDGPRPIQRRSEGTATSNIDREYFSGGERRWNTGSGAWANHHFTRDHLGSVREVLDSSGTLRARYDYAPYGERQTRYEASGYSSDIGFTGHFHLPSPVSGQSEILLAHYRAYDPVLGRWLSQDPIREMGGINLYGYVGGRVAEWTDPLGLLPSVVMRYVNDPPKTEAERTGVVCGALVGPTIIVAVVSGPAVVGFRGLIMRNPGTVAKVTAALDETGVIAGTIGSALLLKRSGWGGPTLVSGQGGGLSRTHVDKYKTMMRAGEAIPRIGVCENARGVVQIGEGNHRLRAAIELGDETKDWSHLKSLLDNAAKRRVETFPFDTHPLPEVKNP